MTSDIPVNDWIWQGMPAHFCAASECWFRLSTVVGRYIVSTVGDYRPNRAAIAKEIGCDRNYETYVFHRGEPCGCGCGDVLIKNASEIDSLPANDGKTARDNHMALCHKWAKLQDAGAD